MVLSGGFVSVGNDVEDFLDRLARSDLHITLDIMPREIDPPSIQRDFVLAALGEGKRLDGRLPLEMRDVRLEFGEELGVCTCHLGKTL